MGAMVGAPLVALLASPLACAEPDDVTSTVYGPLFTFTDTVSTNSATDGIDSFLTSPDWGGLDVFYTGPTSNTFEVLLTETGVYQVGFEDVAGQFSFIDITNPTELGSLDPGLADISGVAAAL